MTSLYRRLRLRSVVMDGPTTAPEPAEAPAISMEALGGTSEAMSVSLIETPPRARVEDLSGARRTVDLEALISAVIKDEPVYMYMGDHGGPFFGETGVLARKEISNFGAATTITLLAGIPSEATHAITAVYFYTRQGNYIAYSIPTRQYYVGPGDLFNFSLDIRIAG